MITLINAPHQCINILAFDTSGDEASVALWANEKMHKASLPFGTGIHSQAARLLSVIQELLREANMTFQDLNVIATPVGPGSFTGIRLGLATAQGLILSTKAISFAPTTFQNCAFGAWREKTDSDGFSNASSVDSFLVTLATKRDSFYTQAFDKTLNVLFPATISTEDEVKDMLAANSRMLRVEHLSILRAESLIYLYFHTLKPGQSLPSILHPYYLHDPEFVKQKLWSL